MGGGKTVTRADLCEAVYQKVGLSRTESAQLVELVLDEISACIVRGESVKLSSFGSFIVRTKRERAGRNPRTGAPVPIEARRVITFKASPNMKAAINGKAPVTKVKKRARGRLAPQNGGAEVVRIFAP